QYAARSSTFGPDRAARAATSQTSRYPRRSPLQVTRCVFRRCTTVAVNTSSSSGPTSALRVAIRLYRVVWIFVGDRDFLAVHEKVRTRVSINALLSYDISSIHQ